MIRLISSVGEQLGIVDLRDALRTAKDEGLDLVIGEDGRLNLMDVFPAGTAEKPQDRQPDKGGGELPINLVIADLRLRGGRLDFQHRPAGLHFQLARLEADADAVGSPSARTVPGSSAAWRSSVTRSGLARLSIWR